MSTEPEVSRQSDADTSATNPVSHPGVSGSIRKQTKKKRARPADIEFANIIERINEGFVALDREMNYTYINQRGS